MMRTFLKNISIVNGRGEGHAGAGLHDQRCGFAGSKRRQNSVLGQEEGRDLKFFKQNLCCL